MGCGWGRDWGVGRYWGGAGTRSGEAVMAFSPPKVIGPMGGVIAGRQWAGTRSGEAVMAFSPPKVIGPMGGVIPPDLVPLRVRVMAEVVVGDVNRLRVSGGAE